MTRKSTRLQKSSVPEVERPVGPPVLDFLKMDTHGELVLAREFVTGQQNPNQVYGDAGVDLDALRKEAERLAMNSREAAHQRALVRQADLIGQQFVSSITKDDIDSNLKLLNDDFLDKYEASLKREMRFGMPCDLLPEFERLLSLRESLSGEELLAVDESIRELASVLFPED